MVLTQLVVLIRSGASGTEFSSGVDTLSDGTGPSKSSQSRFQPPEQPRQVPQERFIAPNELTTGSVSVSMMEGQGDLSTLILPDIQDHKIQAAPWTSVTQDTALISDLISLFFEWYHPVNECIIHSLFLRDMRTGKVDADFCSPFLVNSILAAACAYSDTIETRTNVADAFISEAKTCLDEEFGQISLTTIQALCVLYSTLGYKGHGGLELWYMKQLVIMCEEFYNDSQYGSFMSDTEVLQDQVETKLMVIWSVYSLTVSSNLCWHLPSRMKPPPQEQPRACDNTSVRWLEREPQSISLVHDTFQISRSNSTLSTISAETSRVLFSNQQAGQSKKGSVDEALACYKHYAEWHDLMSKRLRIHDGSSPELLAHQSVISSKFHALR
jgi:hypothetical protein